MRKRIAAVIFAVLAFGLVAASAALLNLTTDEVGAGQANVASCDGDGVAVSYQFRGPNVRGVQLSGVDAACQGQAADVSLLDGTGGLLGTASVGALDVTGDGTESFTFAPPVSASAVNQVSVVISGATVVAGP